MSISTFPAAAGDIVLSSIYLKPAVNNLKLALSQSQLKLNFTCKSPDPLYGHGYTTGEVSVNIAGVGTLSGAGVAVMVALAVAV